MSYNVSYNFYIKNVLEYMITHHGPCDPVLFNK